MRQAGWAMPSGSGPPRWRRSGRHPLPMGFRKADAPCPFRCIRPRAPELLGVGISLMSDQRIFAEPPNPATANSRHTGDADKSLRPSDLYRRLDIHPATIGGPAGFTLSGAGGAMRGRLGWSRLLGRAPCAEIGCIGGRRDAASAEWGLLSL